MTRLLPVALTAALLATAPALAAAPERLKVTATMTVASAEHVTPDGDGDYVVRGPVTSDGLGDGSATYTSSIRDGVVRGSVVTRFERGTVRTSMRGRFRFSGAEGELGRTTGRGRIVGGTGAYRGASGRFRFRAVTGADGTTRMTLTGRVHPPE